MANEDFQRINMGTACTLCHKNRGHVYRTPFDSEVTLCTPCISALGYFVANGEAIEEYESHWEEEEKARSAKSKTDLERENAELRKQLDQLTAPK